MTLTCTKYFSAVELLESMEVDGKNTLDPSCSGILISNDLILTAAHNIGYFSHARFPHTPFDEILEVGEVKTCWREEYDDSQNEHLDLAVIKLSRKIPDTIKPVIILDKGHLIKPNSELIVAGFGILGDEDGKSSLRVFKLPFKEHRENWLMASQSKNAEVCIGDSGGPAYLEILDKMYLAGITTGIHDDFQTVSFMNLHLFKDWILKSAVELNATLPIFEKINN